MKRASISDAKNSFSALLSRVRRGESVIIEDRGIPVAQLTPVVGSAPGPDRDRLARLERLGIIRPPLSSSPNPLLETDPPRPKRPGSLSALVIEERRQGR